MRQQFLGPSVFQTLSAHRSLSRLMWPFASAAEPLKSSNNSWMQTYLKDRYIPSWGGTIQKNKDQCSDCCAEEDSKKAHRILDDSSRFGTRRKKAKSPTNEQRRRI